MNCDGSMEGNAMPAALAGAAQLRVTFNSSAGFGYVVFVFEHTSSLRSLRSLTHGGPGQYSTVPMPSLCLVQFEVVLNRDGIFTKDASFHPKNFKNLLDFTRKPPIHIY